MVTDRQRRTIEEHMRNIKDAINDNKSEKEIEKRTQELYKYLQREGIVMNE